MENIHRALRKSLILVLVAWLFVFDCSPKQGIPHGTTEIFGAEMTQRLEVLKIIESVYRFYGFDVLSTPILEYAQTFKGHHGEGEILQFHLKDHESHELVLRYDLTVPMARYIADHPETPIPFKRYQIATVFRDDEIDKGHFREFTQCDGDTVGISDLTADAEVINLAFTGLSMLGFPDFFINVNHRSIINAISVKCGLSGTAGRLHVQRALDEVSKFTEKCVYRDDINSLDRYKAAIKYILEKRGLSPHAIDILMFVCTLTGSFEQKLLMLEQFLSDSPIGLHGIHELKEIFSYLNSNVQKKVNLDLCLARGADYYTGFILEGSIPNVHVGAVLGGGRYDNLVGDLGGSHLPAVGMAFGLERILTALSDLHISTFSKPRERILVVSGTDKDKQLLLEFANELRMKLLEADFVVMPTKNKDEIIAYAQKRGFSQIATLDNERIMLTQIA